MNRLLYFATPCCPLPFGGLLIEIPGLLYAGVGHESAVDRDRMPVTKPGRFRPTSHTSVPSRSSGLPKRRIGRVGNDFVRPLGKRAVLVGQQRAVLLRQEEARGDRVDADAGFRHMDGQPLREVVDRRFRRAVGGHFRHRARRAHRRDVDDDGAFRPIICFAKICVGMSVPRKFRLTRSRSPLCVRSKKRRDAFLAQILGLKRFVRRNPLRVVAARAVDQDVAGAELAPVTIGRRFDDWPRPARRRRRRSLRRPPA